MSRNIVVEALIRTTLWGVEYRAGQLLGLVRGATRAVRRKGA